MLTSEEVRKREEKDAAERELAEAAAESQALTELLTEHVLRTE